MDMNDFFEIERAAGFGRRGLALAVVTYLIVRPLVKRTAASLPNEKASVNPWSQLAELSGN